MIMRTFYEAYPQLADKTLVPFGTHGGSGISSCEKVMKEYFPNAEYLKSLGISGEIIRNTSSKTTVENWLNEIGILPLITDSDTPDAVDLGLSVKWASYNNSNYASYLYFYSDATRVQPTRSNRRYIGMSVRPVYVDGGAGTENVEISNSSHFNVSIEGYNLRIENLASNIPVSIYDTMGRQIYYGIKHTITVEKEGIYFIKANSYTKKILIRYRGHMECHVENIK